MTTVFDAWKNSRNTFFNKIEKETHEKNKKDISQARQEANKSISKAKENLGEKKKYKSKLEKSLVDSKNNQRKEQLEKKRVKKEIEDEKKRLARVKNNLIKKDKELAKYKGAVKVTRRFVRTWRDKGSGAVASATFYRPVAHRDYISVGDYGQSNYSSPKGAVLTIKRRGPIKWAYPVSYTRIWKDSGSGASWDGSFWRPNPPRGYVAIGMLCQRGHGRKPKRHEVACIHIRHAERTTPGPIIWNDRKSGAHRDVSIYYNTRVGTFYAQKRYGKPKRNSFWTLKESAFIGSAANTRLSSAKSKRSAKINSLNQLKQAKTKAMSVAQMIRSKTISATRSKTVVTRAELSLKRLDKEMKRLRK